MDDRISQLPINTVDHILSFLNTRYGPPKELVRMSVLSKTWFHLTDSFPDLYFINAKFRPRESFFKYVEYTTSRICPQNVAARTFLLITRIEDPAEFDVVNSCLELVLKNGVKELEINITNITNLPNYRLPNTLLSVSVLKSLTICGCELPSSLMADGIKFNSLNFFKLFGVRIDNEGIKYLTNSCPILQTICIILCTGFNSFCVCGHQNLRHVQLQYKTRMERIDIEAPNLSKILLADWLGGGAPRVNLASCKKLTKVTYIENHPLAKSNDFTDFLYNFPFVEEIGLLVLQPCNNLKLSSHSMRRLVLHSDCDLENIELNTPNLDLFVYRGTLSEQYMAGHLTHLKASMGCYLNDYVDMLWFRSLRLFLGKKNGFKVSNLYIRTTQKFTELEKLKAVELPPYELEHVELQLDTREESSSRIAFVDAVLWCCRPRSITLISTSPLTEFEEQSDLVMFTYEKLLQQEDQGHTNIKIVSPSSSLFVALPSKGKFLKKIYGFEDTKNTLISHPNSVAGIRDFGQSFSKSIKCRP
ncbi:putative F-box/LRR-repeat protein At5g15620 [Bidens hawaiensis]|uniref:putative F-box/LRR-repeat protein At5g15620 n=1 Tax=Bidens hawaiensis TaxID=980011 RepID=UPI004049C9B3